MGPFKLFDRKKQETKSGPMLGVFRVPENTSIEVYGPPPAVPTVCRMAGGGLIVSMGVTTDRPVEDFEALLEAVDTAVVERQPDIVLSEAVTLHEACSETAAVTNSRAIFWQLNADVFAMWSVGSKLLQKMLWRLEKYLLEGIAPILFVQEPKSAAGAALLSVHGLLGLQPRGPNDDGSVVVEIHHNTGVIVTGIVGETFPYSGQKSEWFHDLYWRRYEAHRLGDKTKVQEIDKELMEFLDGRLASVRSAMPRTPEIAIKLRQLMWAIPSGSTDDAANEALLRSLVEREAGLVFAIDSTGEKGISEQWPGSRSGLVVYPDLSSARKALCGGKSGRSAVLGNLPSVEVLEWMAREGAGLAIRVDDANDTFRTLYIGHEDVVSALQNFHS